MVLTPTIGRDLSPQAADHSASVEAAMSAARRAEAGWKGTRLRERLRIVRQLRSLIADHCEEYSSAVATAAKPAEVALVSEVVPLLDACTLLERSAARALKTKHYRSTASWLRLAPHVEVRREPLGTTLIIAPSNYPLFLPAVMAIQSFVAGNCVLVKPAPGWSRPMETLRQHLLRSGLPEGVFQVLSEGADAATAAIEQRVDKVFVTGSLGTGRQVLSSAAETITPVVSELSGCDAAIVAPDADVELAARCLRFGLTLNSGFTCIAPRRILVASEVATRFKHALRKALEADAIAPAAISSKNLAAAKAAVDEALEQGGELLCGSIDEHLVRPCVVEVADCATALMQIDLAAPVAGLCEYCGEDDLRSKLSNCCYGLGASIFARLETAQRLAELVSAGAVVINDCVAPTADPRFPFGGRKLSGFGVTRGIEGLLEHTCIKAVAIQRGLWRPHLRPIGVAEASLLRHALRAKHEGSAARRWKALKGLVRDAVRMRNEKKEQG